MTYELVLGDGLEVMHGMEAHSVDAIVCDPPYMIDFMGKAFDKSKGNIAASVELWAEALRVARPGAHLLAFGGDRTHHRLMCAIEYAGWELRTCLYWLTGQGFPKSHNLGNGWGSALKPAAEIIVMARAPLSEPTIAQNVLRWNCGALNIDGCRVEGAWTRDSTTRSDIRGGAFVQGKSGGLECEPQASHPAGRWPTNLLLDPEAAALLDEMSGERKTGAWNGHRNTPKTRDIYGEFASADEAGKPASTGGASRFFPIFAHDDDAPLRMCYQPKASKRDRDEGLEGMPEHEARHAYGDGLNSATKIRTDEQAQNGVNRDLRRNFHPTVKPTPLMRWLVRLITPPGGTVLDPFCGSGSTSKAAILEGFDCIGIDNEAEYVEIARARCAHAAAQYAAARAQPGLFDRG